MCRLLKFFHLTCRFWKFSILNIAQKIHFNNLRSSKKMQHTIILLLAVVFAVYAQQTCTAQWQCASYSSDYNYVQCVDGVCKCRTELGFVGNATSSFPCSCPNVVYWGQGNPYCKKCDSPRKVLYDDSGIPRCVNLGECENTSKPISSPH